MKNPSPRWTSTRRTLRKAALVLSAFTFGATACSGPASTPQQQEQDDTASATFSIKSGDFYSTSGASKGRILSASSLRSAQGFSFSDVTKLRIDVKDKALSVPLYLNFDLLGSSDGWSGTIPFLPKNQTLVFTAKAYNASGTLLFQGTTEQTLSKPSDSVLIALAAANDGRSITIPRIKKISVPSAFGSDQNGNVSFAVEANTGETLTYEIISPEGGGTFYPTTGTLTLTATAGTFVSQYSPPTVDSNTEFEHTVKVTNEAGNSVTTTFKTKVKPPSHSEGSVTDINVLFNPVINSLTASRVQGTGNVIFEAAVADDGAATDLSYTWTFTAAANTSFTPVPVFTGTTNPSTLQNYTTDVQGTIKLEVKDGTGGKTTLSYPLTPNQFPDNPVVEGGLTGINSIRAGENHTCVLFNNGTMRCWGLNASGQLGYENTFSIGDDEKPYTAGDIKLVGVGSKIAVGGNHTCALLDTGLVRCWGNNAFGQLGYNTTEPNIGDGEPVASYGYVNLGGSAVKIAAGFEHTCALMDTGKVRCWGHNNFGQLGYGNTNNVGDNELPYSKGDVDLGGTAKSIVAGGFHTCALMDTGKVRCWGLNSSGQLGLGNTTNVGDQEQPSSVAEVNLGGTAMQLTAGKNHTCALLDTGNIQCWGSNSFGQLGYGNIGNVLSPRGDVAVGGQVLQVSAGESHTCVLLGTGEIKCWGNGTSGRLGYGVATSLSSPPTATIDLDGNTAFQITTGGSHTCALLTTGAARCWGLASSGQLGYGNKTNIGDSELPSAAGDIQVLAP